MKLTLCAADLWSKFGFCDGDIFSSADWRTDDGCHEWQSVLGCDYDPLVDAVMAYLIPAVERAGYSVDVKETNSCHNPIRVVGCTGYSDPPDWAHCVTVEVSAEQVLALIPANYRLTA